MFGRSQLRTYKPQKLMPKQIKLFDMLLGGSLEVWFSRFTVHFDSTSTHFSFEIESKPRAETQIYQFLREMM